MTTRIFGTRCIGSARQFPRCLHTQGPALATPVAYPNLAGPPPHPPQVSNGSAARKRRQVEFSNNKSTALKRFWKHVSVKSGQDGLQVMLDSRPVRTGTKQILTVPHSKRALATAIAMEWDALVSAQQALKQHYIPLTSLASRAVDIQTADAAQNTKTREDIVNMMMRYVSTDTLLCWAPEKETNSFAGTRTGTVSTQGAEPSLRQQQITIAEPIIAHLTTHVFPGVQIEPILDEDSIMPREQPETTQQVIRGWLHGLPAFELAALERGVLATKSLLVAVRLLVEWSKEFSHIPTETLRFGIADAADASTMEVTWQTNMWGEVEDTHDVDREDILRQLGSVVLLVS